MGDVSSTPGPEPTAGGDDDAATQPFIAHAPVTAPWPANLAIPPPPRPQTEVVPPRPQTDVVPPFGPSTEVRAPAPPTQAGFLRPPTAASPPRPQTDLRPFRPPTGVVRYGPGVPVGPSAEEAGLSAERVWRTGQPVVPGRRRPRLRRVLGSSLTVILLTASGVVLYLRFHHPPFHVTGVVISQQTRIRCGVNVIGRISTNGAAGTVSYQWLFQPGQQPPQPLSQSVIAGQHAVFVTVADQGNGHGRASQTVTLQVLGPDPMNASTAVVISC